jgi:hypothetical protein
MALLTDSNICLLLRDRKVEETSIGHRLTVQALVEKMMANCKKSTREDGSYHHRWDVPVDTFARLHLVIASASRGLHRGYSAAVKDIYLLMRMRCNLGAELLIRKPVFEAETE